MTGRATVSDFPRRTAATRRFTLGTPRAFTVSPDGARVVFLRSGHGSDPVQALWVLDTATGEERCVADPAMLGTDDDLPPEERARRERAREQANGIVRYATDRAVGRAVFTVGGAAFLTEFPDGKVVDLGLHGPVIDPRLDPSGTRLAWVADGGLHTMDLATGRQITLATPDGADVTWGLAEFIAAEEMRRSRGYWWAPDGERILAARVSEACVDKWHVAEPADPRRQPTTIAYPAAGTANAEVSLAILGVDGMHVDVQWDADAMPYLTRAFWQAEHPPTIVVQSRDQRTMEVRTIDETTGASTLVERTTAGPWIEIVPGTPRWVASKLLTAFDDLEAGPYGTRRLALDGHPVTPAGLHVRDVAGADEHSVVVTASGSDPTGIGVWRVPLDGNQPTRLDTDQGVASVSGGPGAHVLTQSGLTGAPVSTAVAGGASHTIASFAEEPSVELHVELLELGPNRLRGALLLPDGHQESDGPLPVLLDPYGGPHAQRVLRARNAFLASQWFADQGFAVLVVDGRGSPARGPAWEHAVAGDLAALPLADQVDALQAVAEQRPGLLDLDRVAIRGWSFGGYLAAPAVLRRPDVFHAGVAGAPVTDWRLYDTHYTERYLGDPRQDSEPYSRSSLLEDAGKLERPLLLIHGLADDNVVAAHTLQLSRALLEAGRPHQVLPLSGVTHMTPQEVVAENLLTLQVAFIRDALGSAEALR